MPNSHELERSNRVVWLFPEEDYRFLERETGASINSRRNSVLEARFDDWKLVRGCNTFLKKVRRASNQYQARVVNNSPAHNGPKPFFGQPWADVRVLLTQNDTVTLLVHCNMKSCWRLRPVRILTVER